MENKLIDIIRINSEELLPIPTNEIQYSNSSVKIESIIFDIYGTLLISASGDIGTLKGNNKSDIFLNSLKFSGINICSEQAGIIGKNIFYNEIKNSHISSSEQKIEYPEVVITEIWKKTLTALVEKKLINTKVSSDIVGKTATYFECYTNPVWPMPDLVKVLNILSKKTVLGIVSNAQFYTPLLFKALTNYSLQDLGFDPLLIEYSYNKKEAKPSISMFNTIISKLKSIYNIEPSNTLYIGNDMLNDIYSANKAGLKTALFAGDKRSLRFRENEPRVKGIKPDFLVSSLMQITKLIK